MDFRQSGNWIWGKVHAIAIEKEFGDTKDYICEETGPQDKHVLEYTAKVLALDIHIL